MNRIELDKILNSELFQELEIDAEEHIKSFTKAKGRKLTDEELFIFISGFISGKIYEKENRSDT